MNLIKSASLHSLIDYKCLWREDDSGQWVRLAASQLCAQKSAAHPIFLPIQSPKFYLQQFNRVPSFSHRLKLFCCFPLDLWDITRPDWVSNVRLWEERESIKVKVFIKFHQAFSVGHYLYMPNMSKSECERMSRHCLIICRGICTNNHLSLFIVSKTVSAVWNQTLALIIHFNRKKKAMSLSRPHCFRLHWGKIVCLFCQDLKCVESCATLSTQRNLVTSLFIHSWNMCDMWCCASEWVWCECVD